MKVTLRRQDNILKVYIPKKDMETTVMNKNATEPFGGLMELENGMVIFIDPQEPTPSLPVTLTARRIS